MERRRRIPLSPRGIGWLLTLLVATLAGLLGRHLLEGEPERSMLFPTYWEVKTRGVGVVPKATFALHRGDAERDGWIAGKGNGNVRHSTYAGPDVCRDCHVDNYAEWSEHAHRRMNQLADADSVLGDFTDREPMVHLGGKIRFFKEGGEFRMRWWRDTSTNEFVILRTIGSRVSQAYTGVHIDRLHDDAVDAHLNEVVLPFTWWIAQQEWSPLKHVHGEVDSDRSRWDPFVNPPGRTKSYDTSCAHCHTTSPFGERMLRHVGLTVAKQLPREISLGYQPVVRGVHTNGISAERLTANVRATISELRRQSSQKHSVTLGISCEACHFGCLDHVTNSTRTASQVLPHFFPSDPNLFVNAPTGEQIYSRSVENKNFICAQCHIGERPMYASGQHTWNSTEYADAVNGFCYTRTGSESSSAETLSCVHCHEPHRGIGSKWSNSRQTDNQSCLDCHDKFGTPDALSKHTHHAPASVGSDCMNCHMPRIHEGLADVVRTHRISNPTDARMIEANQPNACNICHVEKRIDWTIEHLKQWFDASYDEGMIAASYPNRNQAVALGWLRSGHAPTRLIGGRSLVAQRAVWALDDLVTGLNDSHFVNRQFLERSLQTWAGLEFKEFGYRHYHTEDQRPESIEAVRRAVKLKISSGSGG